MKWDDVRDRLEAASVIGDVEVAEMHLSLAPLLAGELHAERHPVRRPAADLRAFLPRRQSAVASCRRHRIRLVDREARCGANGRNDKGGEPFGTWIDVHDHSAAGVMAG